MFPAEFLNWWDDENIVIFEESLTKKELAKLRPYMTMFHVLKLEYKRLKALET